MGLRSNPDGLMPFPFAYQSHTSHMSSFLGFTDSAVYGHSDKRRGGKPLTFNQSINYQLDDSDILDDLKIINKNKAFSMHSSRYNVVLKYTYLLTKM